jgi:YggT family protein
MQSLFWAIYVYFLSPVLGLLFLALLVYVIMGWLFTFGVVSPRQPAARAIWEFLDSIIRPLARPIRRLVPPIGQLDLSVFLLGAAILFTRDFALPSLIGLLP